MFAKLLTTIIALQATLATAGQTITVNQCSYGVWLWSVAQGPNPAPVYLAPYNGRHTEPFRQTCNNCGISLKVSRTNQLINGQQTQFEYSVKNGQVDFDISFVNCADGGSAANCPGHEGGLHMYSGNPKCSSASCDAGSYCPNQAYYVDNPPQKLGLPAPVFGCTGAGTNLNLYSILCSQNPTKRSIAGRVEVDFSTKEVV